MSLSVCVCLFLHLSISLCLSNSVILSPPLSFCLCLSVSVSLPLFLHLSPLHTHPFSLLVSQIYGPAMVSKIKDLNTRFVSLVEGLEEAVAASLAAKADREHAAAEVAAKRSAEEEAARRSALEEEVRAHAQPPSTDHTSPLISFTPSNDNLPKKSKPQRNRKPLSVSASLRRRRPRNSGHGTKLLQRKPRRRPKRKQKLLQRKPAKTPSNAVNKKRHSARKLLGKKCVSLALFCRGPPTNRPAAYVPCLPRHAHTLSQTAAKTFEGPR